MAPSLMVILPCRKRCQRLWACDACQEQRKQGTYDTISQQTVKTVVAKDIDFFCMNINSAAFLLFPTPCCCVLV